MDSGVCSAINYVWDVIHTVLSLLISFSICNGQFQIALFLFIFSVVFCFYLFLSIFLFNYLKFFYSAVLVSAIQQCNLAIIIHTSPPSLDSLSSLHPIPSGHQEGQTGLPVLHSNFSPAVHPILDSVYMLMLLSSFIPLSPSPTVSTSPFSTSASRFIPCK